VTFKSFVLGAALLVSALTCVRSEGAIAIHAVSGASEQWFYSSNAANTLTIANVTVGSYTFTNDFVGSNYSGTTTLGEMTNTLTVTVNTNASASLVLHAYQVNDNATYDTGNYLIGRQISQTPSDPLQTLSSLGLVESIFSRPDPRTSIFGGVTLNGAGSASITTFVNADSVSAASAPVFPNVSGGSNSKSLLKYGGYTLSQLLTVSTPTTTSSVLVTGDSRVEGPGGSATVPEPATMAIWSLGLGIAGLVRLRRKK